MNFTFSRNETTGIRSYTCILTTVEEKAKFAINLIENKEKVFLGKPIITSTPECVKIVFTERLGSRDRLMTLEDILGFSQNEIATALIDFVTNSPPTMDFPRKSDVICDAEAAVSTTAASVPFQGEKASSGPTTDTEKASKAPPAVSMFARTSGTPKKEKQLPAASEFTI